MEEKSKRKVIRNAILLFFVGFIVYVFLLWPISANMWDTVGKPVIYLYPEQTQQITVSVIADGDIFISDPEINENSWVVTSTSNSEITFEGQTYPYLFYESFTAQNLDMDEGWLVSSEDIVDWFNEYLLKFGLIEAEIKDFVEYWEVHLPDSEYYQVSLLDGERLDKSTKLIVDPEPDTVIRVILVIKSLDSPVEFEVPEITTPSRDGFVVSEWGVILT